MPIRPDRRQTLALLATSCLATLLPAAAFAEPVLGDVVMGDEAASVTVIEYASFTCGHCANFHIESWPRLKADYIDTGKVKFILREVYFDKYGLWASMTARCGGEAAFYPLAGQLMDKQDVWARVPEAEIPGQIKKIGRLNGLSDAQYDACLSDSDYAKALVDAYKSHATADKIDSTPTFLINGERVNGNLPDKVFAAIDKLL